MERFLVTTLQNYILKTDAAFIFDIPHLNVDLYLWLYIVTDYTFYNNNNYSLICASPLVHCGHGIFYCNAKLHYYNAIL